MPSLPFAVIPVPLGTLTSVGNERSEKPAAHLGEFRHIGMTWRSNGNSSLSIRGDFGSAQPVDFFSVVQANAQAGTTARLVLTNDPTFATYYDTGPATIITSGTTDPNGLYTSHREFVVQNVRYWQLDIGSHTGDFEAAMLVMGQKVTPGTFYSQGFEYGVEDKGSLDFGRYGVPEDQPGVIMRALRFTLGWLNESDMETKFRPLDQKLGKRGMALWCFDPTANAYRQTRTYFGVLKDPPYATGGVNNTRYSKEYSILSVI